MGNLNQCLFKAFSLLLFFCVCSALPAYAGSREDDIAALKKEKDEALFRIQDIVNQPVTHLKRTPDMIVKRFTTWGGRDFSTPNFDTVDVRASQQKMFDGYQYVACDQNPGEVFIGKDLEFNEMTKYFYNDFTVPKKKLTEAEMLEINRLCRVIGRCNEQLDELQNPVPLLSKIHVILTENKPLVILLVAVLFMALYFARKRRVEKMEN